MIRLDLLHPTEPDPSPAPTPPLTAEELALLHHDLDARERDGGPWPRAPEDTTAALSGSNLANLYARAGRIDDAVALWRRSALFYEAIGHELKAIAVWRTIRSHNLTDAETEEHLAALSKRLGLQGV